MNFEEKDKPLIKSISSNIIRAERVEDDTSKIGYLAEIVKESFSFGILLKNRGDFNHSKEYIETAVNCNKILRDILQREYDSVFVSFHMEEDKK